MIKTPKLYRSGYSFWRSLCGNWPLCTEDVQQVFDIPENAGTIQFTGHEEPAKGCIKMKLGNWHVTVFATTRTFKLVGRTGQRMHRLIGLRDTWYVECHCWPAMTWKDYLTLGLLRSKMKVEAKVYD